MAKRQTKQTKPPAKTFAELSLENAIRRAKVTASDLEYQLRTCGIENIHTYSTLQVLITEIQLASVWTAVVRAEKGL